MIVNLPVILSCQPNSGWFGMEGQKKGGKVREEDEVEGGGSRAREVKRGLGGKGGKRIGLL